MAIPRAITLLFFKYIIYYSTFFIIMPLSEPQGHVPQGTLHHPVPPAPSPLHILWPGIPATPPFQGRKQLEATGQSARTEELP